MGQVIMVQMADRQWTMVAMHLACAIAQNKRTEIILVRMVPIQHLGWLGSEYGRWSLSRQDSEDLREYTATAKEYGVNLSKQVYQYSTLADALADAAGYFGARTVFATLPSSVLPYWHCFQVWYLRRRLTQDGRELHTLEKPENTTAWTPAILSAQQSKH
jgi:hypothetical protein